MGKKQSEEDKLADTVDELLEAVGDDRKRLSDFFDLLLSEYKDQPGGIAEHVSKIADSLTKQNQVRVAVLKSITKNSDPQAEEDEENDEIAKAIGRPFDAEPETSGN